MRFAKFTQTFRTLDQYLLLNYPLLWASKLHVGLPIALAINLLALFVIAVTPFSLDGPVPPIIEMTMIFGVLGGLGFLYWGYQQWRFAEYKHRGEIPVRWAYTKLFIIHVMVFMCALPAVLSFELLRKKVMDEISLKEIELDLEQLDRADPFFISIGHDGHLQKLIECLCTELQNFENGKPISEKCWKQFSRYSDKYNEGNLEYPTESLLHAKKLYCIPDEEILAKYSNFIFVGEKYGTPIGLSKEAMFNAFKTETKTFIPNQLPDIQRNKLNEKIWEIQTLHGLMLSANEWTRFAYTGFSLAIILMMLGYSSMLNVILAGVVGVLLMVLDFSMLFFSKIKFNNSEESTIILVAFFFLSVLLITVLIRLKERYFALADRILLILLYSAIPLMPLSLLLLVREIRNEGNLFYMLALGYFLALATTGIFHRMHTRLNALPKKK